MSFAALHLLAADTSSKSSSGFLQLPFLLLLVGGFYFVAIRPQRKRMRALREVQTTIVPGREVMTTAGLYATVVEIDDEMVTLEIAPGVHARFSRSAVVRTVDEDPEDVPLDDVGFESGDDDADAG